MHSIRRSNSVIGLTIAELYLRIRPARRMIFFPGTLACSVLKRTDRYSWLATPSSGLRASNKSRSQICLIYPSFNKCITLFPDSVRSFHILPPNADLKAAQGSVNRTDLNPSTYVVVIWAWALPVRSQDTVCSSQMASFVRGVRTLHCQEAPTSCQAYSFS